MTTPDPVADFLAECNGHAKNLKRAGATNAETIQVQRIRMLLSASHIEKLVAMVREYQEHLKANGMAGPEL